MSLGWGISTTFLVQGKEIGTNQICQGLPGKGWGGGGGVFRVQFDKYINRITARNS